MRKSILVIGGLFLALASLAVSFAGRDPLSELERFHPTMTRNLESNEIWVRKYTFPKWSLALYEYLEEHRGDNWNGGIPVAYANGWAGSYDPAKRVLTVTEYQLPSLWDQIKERLGFGSQGCG